MGDNDNGPDHSQFGEQPIILDFFRTTDRRYSRFCVDAGAFDGTVGSNSRAIFQQGWPGIAIEPNPRSFERLSALYKDRPDIICIQNALSSQPASAAQMKFCVGPIGTPEEDKWQYGQVSTLSDFFAKHYETNHQWTYEAGFVDIVTLTSVLREHGASRDFGFLSIDCEAEDLKVLEGFDMEEFRPLLICVECGDPHRHLFSNLLEPKGYVFHAKTQSNSFYVRGNDEGL
jgi:FkbM family methyltransferase